MVLHERAIELSELALPDAGDFAQQTLAVQIHQAMAKAHEDGYRAGMLAGAGYAADLGETAKSERLSEMKD